MVDWKQKQDQSRVRQKGLLKLLSRTINLSSSCFVRCCEGAALTKLIYKLSSQPSPVGTGREIPQIQIQTESPQAWSPWQPWQPGQPCCFCFIIYIRNYSGLIRRNFLQPREGEERAASKIFETCFINQEISAHQDSEMFWH